MAYTRFSETCDWYIYWSTSAAESPEEERVEAFRAGSAQPVVISFAEAEKAAETGRLPQALANVESKERATIIAALGEFALDVRTHYATKSMPSPQATAGVIEEAERASRMLRNKLVSVVRRPTARQVMIEFTDGSRLLVNAASDELELSIE